MGKNNIIKMKICTNCNSELPMTKKHFLLKPKRKNNNFKVKEQFRSCCKKCWYKKTTESRILKRCKEEGIKRDEWEDFKRINLLKRDMFKFKDEKLKDFERPLRRRILRKIREDGYFFTTIENYYKDCAKNRSKSQRKYNYNYDDVLTNKIISDKMPDYYIANRMRLSVKDIPKEIIKTKRLILTLKRELNYGS